MVRATQETIDDLLGRFGKTFGDHLGLDVASGGAEPLFQLLCVSILTCARAPSLAGLSAAARFGDLGWTSAETLSLSSWRGRVQVLNEAGFSRSQERMSFILGAVADRVRDRYDGDLSELRESAGHEPAAERELLKELRGVGDLAANHFFREAQAAWDELQPYLDERVLIAAAKLGLPDDPEQLASSVAPEDLPRLACALGHVDTHDAYEAVRGSATVV